jgi:hypothetical protein
MKLSDWLWQDKVVAEEQARQRRYQKVWDAYFGRLPKPLVVKPGKPDDNVALNYVRLIIDASVAFLFGQEPEFELLEGQESPAEEWLDACWRENKKMQLLQKLGINGAACGHVYLKLAPAAQPGGYPRLINLSPEYVTVICDPDDIDLVWRYIIEYPARGKDGERLTVRQTVERDAGQTWTVTDEVSVNDGKWQVREAIVWPWGWAPILDCQNLPSPNEYYGIADVEEDVLALNYSLNFTLSNLQRIVRYHAHPKTWGKGITAKELSIGVDETILLPNPAAELHNLEMTTDLSSLLDLFARLKDAMHETTRTPEVATGKLVDGTGQLSGVALQILYQPLVQKTNAKRLTYGELLTECNRRLLDMAGYGPDNWTTLRWPEILPKNALEERQVLLLDKQLGVSNDTLMTKADYDPEQEREKRANDGEQLGEQLLTAFDQGQ